MHKARSKFSESAGVEVWDEGSWIRLKTVCGGDRLWGDFREINGCAMRWIGFWVVNAL